MEQVKKSESNQEDSDKKGKGKAPKTANLLARIDDEIPLIDRMEDIDNYNERVFVALESDKTNKVVQMDVDEDAVSLGDDDTYEDARQFYTDHNFEGDEDYTKYGNGLLIVFCTLRDGVTSHICFVTSDFEYSYLENRSTPCLCNLILIYPTYKLDADEVLRQNERF